MTPKVTPLRPALRVRLLAELDALRATRNDMIDRARGELSAACLNTDDTEAAAHLARAGVLHEYAARLDTTIQHIESHHP